MITILEIFFFIVLVLVINSFFIYPLVIYLFGRKKREIQTDSNYQPTISILIAAFNEEKVIEERIKNIAGLNYDLGKVEVLIGSDDSSDRTNEILFENEKKYSWLKPVVSSDRKGKAGILNELIKKVNNEIVIFTDANTVFEKEVLKNLVRDFADPKVGGVCGRLILVDNETIRNEGVEEAKYWQYETFIKYAEGKCGILLAANGGIFAIRKELYKDIPTEKAVTDDLFVSLSILSQNYKFTFAKDAAAREYTGLNLLAEYNRKVRFGATNFQTLIYFKNLLWHRNLLLSYSFLSHKVTRWFLPALLVTLFIFSFFLADVNTLIRKIYFLQLAFYLLALGGYLLALIKVRIQIFSIPYFFVVSNTAIAEGFIKFIRNKHSVTWESTER
ncbi:MAG: glycosyltransferase family 2 protein [Bacteroidota bacterium]